MKKFNVVYENILNEEATIEAKSRKDAMEKLANILPGVRVIEAWELKPLKGTSNA